MDGIGTELVTLLQYLLPGFLAAWVFYGFTSHPKPSQFERIVQALVFTFLIKGMVYCTQWISLCLGRFVTVGAWTEHSELVWALTCATFLGLAFAHFSNSDKFHAMIRKLGITRETSYPSEWFGALSNNVTYVVLHLEDERRVYGWPMEWPSEARKGHFLLTQASWLHEENETSMTGVESILVRGEDVRWVEFMKMNQEQDDGQESIESAAAAT